MKKLILPIGIAALLIAACGKKEETTAPAATEAPAATQPAPAATQPAPTEAAPTTTAPATTTEQPATTEQPKQ